MSGFLPILRELCERVPGAVGAIFADWEGEPVDQFAPELPELDIQIVGAQWGLVWTEVRQSLARAALGAPEGLLVDGERGSVLVRGVTDRYYVVLSLRAGSPIGLALHELERGAGALAREM